MQATGGQPKRALQAVLHKIITRMMRLPLVRRMLVEEEDSTYMADNDGN